VKGIIFYIYHNRISIYLLW